MTNKHELVSQPTSRPTNKVAAAGLTGGALTLVLALLDVATSSDNYDGAWWGALAASAAATLAGYLRKNRRTDV